jgi:SAM-dependent methyltransferase
MPSSTQQAYLNILGQMMGGYARTQLLYVTAKLNLADLLAAGPQAPRDLALRIDVHPRSLQRFLRYMVAFQLATETADGRFALAPLGEFLRSDHPESVRKAALYTGAVNYPAAGGILHSVRAGTPAFDHVFGQPYFDYCGQNLEIAELFNDLMGRASQDRAKAIVAAYDFSAAQLIVDLGGGNGTLLAAILEANPGVRGVVYDRPAVVPEAEAYLAARCIAGRGRAVGGSFFESVPADADILILSHVIHDWDDPQSARILGNCAAAMRPTSRLLLVEEVLSERVSDGPSTVLADMAMMLLTSGFERTRNEYRELLAAAGLDLARVLPFEPARVPTGKSNWALLEARTVNSRRDAARPPSAPAAEMSRHDAS